MTAAELMTPRYVVIADYPGNVLEIGSIVEVYPGKTQLEFIEKYPHLFRKMNWWEKRTEEQMPKKLICKAIKDDNRINVIEKWDMKNLFGYTNLAERQGCGLRSFNPDFGYFPVD